jgi:hypothetical protein
MVTALIGTLLGTALGALLSWLITRDATAKERGYQEGELIRQRREATATALRDELPSIRDATPLHSMKASEAILGLEASHRLVHVAWNRASFLRDASINRCYLAFNSALAIGILNAEETGPLSHVNPWALTFALDDLQECLDAYLLREPPPAPIFPHPQEMNDLIGSSPMGLAALNAEMRKRWLARERQRANSQTQ